jgi:hypothetical protein
VRFDTLLRLGKFTGSPPPFLRCRFILPICWMGTGPLNANTLQSRLRSASSLGSEHIKVSSKRK